MLLSDAFFITLTLYIFIHLAAVHFILVCTQVNDDEYDVRRKEDEG